MDEIPIGFGDLERIAAAKSRGVVDQAVERPELLFHLAKHALDVVDLFEIGLKQRRVDPHSSAVARASFSDPAVMNRDAIARSDAAAARSRGRCVWPRR